MRSFVVVCASVVALPGCFSPADLRREPPRATLAFRGDVDEVGACLLSTLEDGLIVQTRRGPLSIPGRVVEVEQVTTDVMQWVKYGYASWLLRARGDGTFTAEVRTRFEREAEWARGELLRCAGEPIAAPPTASTQQ